MSDAIESLSPALLPPLEASLTVLGKLDEQTERLCELIATHERIAPTDGVGGAVLERLRAAQEKLEAARDELVGATLLLATGGRQ
jgi:hypothetical protein